MEAELESGRTREVELTAADRSNCERCWRRSDEWLHIEKGELSQAISCGLELIGAEPLAGVRQQRGSSCCRICPAGCNPIRSWMHTLDTLRAPRRKGQPLWEWRKEQPVRPVVFSDQGSLDAHTVHLHLEHRFVQRLLGRFRSQGFVHNDLSRACIGVSDDPVARVILLGRLSVYGERASRLHDEVLAVAARWTDASIRKEALKPYAGETLDKTLGLLDKALECRGGEGRLGSGDTAAWRPVHGGTSTNCART